MGRRRARRLGARAAGRGARLPQPVRRAVLDAAALRPGRTARGLLRGPGPARPDERGREDGVLRGARQHLGLTARLLGRGLPAGRGSARLLAMTVLLAYVPTPVGDAAVTA